MRASHVVERRARSSPVEDDDGQERARWDGTPVVGAPAQDVAGAAGAAEDGSGPRLHGTRHYLAGAGEHRAAGLDDEGDAEESRGSSVEAVAYGRDNSTAAPPAEKVYVGDVVNGGFGTNSDSNPRAAVLHRDGGVDAASRVVASPATEDYGGDAAAGTGGAPEEADAAGAMVVLTRGKKADAWHQAENGRSSDETCAICLAEYEGGCLLRVIVPCGHMFHTRQVGWSIGWFSLLV